MLLTLDHISDAMSIFFLDGFKHVQMFNLPIGCYCMAVYGLKHRYLDVWKSSSPYATGFLMQFETIDQVFWWLIYWVIPKSLSSRHSQRAAIISLQENPVVLPNIG